MVKLKKVGECLYRSHEGGYFALIKVRGKQIKRSLKTKDLTLAKRRLREFRAKSSGLVLEKEESVFSAIARRWLDQTAPELKASSLKRRASTVKGLLSPISETKPSEKSHWPM